jgi:tetratricopeptide (TPR) repeat protein
LQQGSEADTVLRLVTPAIMCLAVPVVRDLVFSTCRAGFVVLADLLNPNLAVAWQRSGWIRTYAGDCEIAIEHLRRGMRLNPLDPLMRLAYSATAFGYFLLGELDEASGWAERALHLQPNWPPALRVLAVSNALAGRAQATQQAMSRLRLIQPQLRLFNLHEQTSLHRPEHMARFTGAMRKAGLPE